MVNKEQYTAKELVIDVAKAIEEFYEALQELAEQLRPLVEAVEKSLKKVLETDDETLQEITLYTDSNERKLLKLIMEYKKIYKRYEPP